MELKSHEWDVVLKFTAGGTGARPEWDDPLLTAPHTSTGDREGILHLLKDLKARASTTLLRWERIAGLTYRYLFKTTSGRTWRQQIKVASPLEDAEMSFSVPDFWAIRELKGGRASLTERLIELTLAYPELEELEVTWHI